jgi:hypothetical protein
MIRNGRSKAPISGAKNDRMRMVRRWDKRMASRGQQAGYIRKPTARGGRIQDLALEGSKLKGAGLDQGPTPPR